LKRILIIGANGFVGSHLCCTLENSHSILRVVRSSNHTLNPGISLIKISEITTEDVKNISYIIFCHSQRGVNYTQKNYEESISALRKILNLVSLKEKTLKGVIYISSFAIYRALSGGVVGNHTKPNFDNDDWYAKCKIEEEMEVLKFAKANGINYLVMRSPTIIGNGFHGNLISKVYNSLKHNLDIDLFNKDIKYNALVEVNSIINIITSFIAQDKILLNNTVLLSSTTIDTLENIVNSMKSILSSRSSINWGTSIMRGPSVVIQEDLIFSRRYLMPTNKILENMKYYD